VSKIGFSLEEVVVWAFCLKTESVWISMSVRIDRTKEPQQYCSDLPFMYPSEGSEITRENLIKKAPAKRVFIPTGYLSGLPAHQRVDGRSLLHFDLHSFSI
jgi:hypothetical protein